MPLESIRVSAIIPASPARIYRAWLNSEEHSVITGSKAWVKPLVGSRFTAWDGYIQGTLVALEQDKRITQNWRTSEFPPNHPDSRLTVLLEPVSTGTRVTLDHTEIPEGQGSQYEEGWRTFYLVPMRQYFEAKRAESGDEEEPAPRVPPPSPAAPRPPPAPAAAVPSKATPSVEEEEEPLAPLEQAPAVTEEVPAARATERPSVRVVATPLSTPPPPSVVLAPRREPTRPPPANPDAVAKAPVIQINPAAEAPSQEDLKASVRKYTTARPRALEEGIRAYASKEADVKVELQDYRARNDEAEPTSPKPARKKSAARKGAAKPAKRGAGKPAAKRPAPKPAARKPAARTSSTRKPAGKTSARKPAARKPVKSKPAARTSPARKPAARKKTARKGTRR